MLLFWLLAYLLLETYLEIIVDIHVVLRNNVKGFHLLFFQFSLMIIFYIIAIQGRPTQYNNNRDHQLVLHELVCA